MVEEAHGYVQGVSLKPCAALLREVFKLPDRQGSSMAQQYSLAQGCGGLVAIAVLGFGAVTMCSPHEGQKTITADDKPTGPLGIIKSSGEITDAKYVTAIGTLVRERGYECPQVINLWIKGNSPYGPKLEALCGEAGSKEPEVSWNYTVYPDRFQVIVCKPFGVLDDGCE